MYWEADKAQLDELCQEVHRLVTNREYEKAKALAEQAMAAYPNAPQPHNLLGIVLEKMQCHALAMRHFRAAYALDPGYGPVGKSLDTFGTFRTWETPNFGDEDCEHDGKGRHGKTCDANGTGHVTRR